MMAGGVISKDVTVKTALFLYKVHYNKDLRFEEEKKNLAHI